MGTEVLRNSTSFLTFIIGSGLYGINVSKIQNIIEISRISVQSNGSSFIIGQINLRGNSLPVTDIRPKLGFAQTEFTDNTCVVVMELKESNQKVLVGILVDSLNEVSEQSENDFEGIPESFLNSVIKEKKITALEQKFQLLDVEKLFNRSEMDQLLKYKL